MIKELIQQEDSTLINIYDPNIGAPKYKKKKKKTQIHTTNRTDIKRETDGNTIIETDGNTTIIEHPTYINGQIL